MANLSITRRCRRHCSYCFARHELARDAVLDMPPEVFDAALALLKRTGFPEARLLGGEPTEHPLFSDYVARARAQGFRVVVFSGGYVPATALDCLAALPVDGVLVVLNTADPAADTEDLVARQRALCRTLGERVMLGVNIRSQDQDPTYVFDWVREFGLCGAIRVGIAHPTWGGTNTAFRFRGPRQVPVVERMLTMGEQRGVKVGLDCGFTPCMFSPAFVAAHADLFDAARSAPEPPASAVVAAQAGAVARQAEAVGVRCNPVIDILPEGDCIACYALSRFRRVPLPADGTREALVAPFVEALATMLPAGVYRECLHCDYRAKGMCGGGCKARRSHRLRPNALAPLPAAASQEVS